MTSSLDRRKGHVFFLVTLLLFTANCTTVNRIVKSADPYHTEDYKRVCDEWTRQARIHRGLEVMLIASATFNSKEFRRAYADEYVKAYKLTPEDRKRFIQDHVDAAAFGHEFLMATYVPEKKWDDFDRLKSTWKIYLTNDMGERVVPVEVRKLNRQDAVTPHFYPYLTPWKSIYTVRFPSTMPGSNRPIIGSETKGIKLVITGVLGTAEMAWDLE